jgi:uncharacterized LabA/DUF88 family protein
MRDISIASNIKNNHNYLKVFIFWDYQNTRLSLHEAQLLLTFAKSQGRLTGKNVYYNSQCKDQAAVKEDMSSLGFNCVNVPCNLKDSADNQLIADCLEEIDSNMSPDIVILISGDGDFIKLVRNLQKLGKKNIMFAQLGNVKQKLKELADEFYFVDDLPKLVVEITQVPTTFVADHINYSEAIEYLTEAIKTAFSQNKPTKFSSINNLMLQICPNYQGISSIQTPDGKKFKSFSQFVDAAVKDGKVRNKNQELFLIELDKVAA